MFSNIGLLTNNAKLPKTFIVYFQLESHVYEVVKWHDRCSVTVQQWSLFHPFLMLYLTTTFAKSQRRFSHIRHFSTVLQEPAKNWPFSSLFDILCVCSGEFVIILRNSIRIGTPEPKPKVRVFASLRWNRRGGVFLPVRFVIYLFNFFFLLQPQMSYVTARGQMADTVTTQNKCIISIFFFFVQMHTKLCYRPSYLLTPKIITLA